MRQRGSDAAFDQTVGRKQALDRSTPESKITSMCHASRLVKHSGLGFVLGVVWGELILA